jgi:hypothetical protein
LKFVGFEILAAADMNVAIFSDIAPCSPILTNVSVERVIICTVYGPRPSYLIHAGVVRSFETLVHIRTTRRYIQED